MSAIKPAVGEVWCNPRGRNYLILSVDHATGYAIVSVVGDRGKEDRAFIPLMTANNGWVRVQFAERDLSNDELKRRADRHRQEQVEKRKAEGGPLVNIVRLHHIANGETHAEADEVREMAQRLIDADNVICWGVACVHQAKALDRSYDERLHGMECQCATCEMARRCGNPRLIAEDLRRLAESTDNCFIEDQRLILRAAAVLLDSFRGRE